MKKRASGGLYLSTGVQRPAVEGRRDVSTDTATVLLELATGVVGLLVVVARLTTETVDWWSARRRGGPVDDPTPRSAGVGDAGGRRSGVERTTAVEDDGA